MKLTFIPHLHNQKNFYKSEEVFKTMVMNGKFKGDCNERNVDINEKKKER